MNTLASAAEVPLSGVHQINENQPRINAIFATASTPAAVAHYTKNWTQKTRLCCGGFFCLLCFSRPGETRAKVERLKIAIYFVSQLLLNHTLVGKTVSTIFTIATSSPQFGPSTILITSPLIFLLIVPDCH